MGRDSSQGNRTKLTVLGSGTSHGIPVAGCGCPVCRSADNRNNRYRSSLLIEGNADECVVIDSGPEFRLQTVRAGITHLDALLITHTHADHLHGIDDVRPFTCQQALNVYAASDALREIAERFPYIINKAAQEGGGIPKITFNNAEKDILIGSLRAVPLKIKHGILDILGWKIIEPASPVNSPAGAAPEKCAAYLTDASFVFEDTKMTIAGCEVLIVGSLRAVPHETHFSFDQAMSFAAEIGDLAVRMRKPPLRKVFLTHICHNHSHTEIIAYCENWRKRRGLDIDFAPAYDGLEIIV